MVSQWPCAASPLERCAARDGLRLAVPVLSVRSFVALISPTSETSARRGVGHRLVDVFCLSPSRHQSRHVFMTRSRDLLLAGPVSDQFEVTDFTLDRRDVNGVWIKYHLQRTCSEMMY